MGNSDPDLPSGIVFFLLFAILGTLLLMVTKNNREALHTQTRLFLWAFAIRFAAAVAIYSFGLVGVLGDEDSSGWVVGVAYAKDWAQRGVDIFQLPSILGQSFSQHHLGYYYLLGTFFYFTDIPARLPAAVLNCFFGALIVVFAYRIARALFSEWVATRVGWAVCLFPSMIVWSAQTIKEPIVMLLETVALYGCVQLKLKGFSMRHAVLCALAILLMIPFRFYAAYVSVAAVALTLIMPRFGKGKVSIGASVGLAVILLPILLGSGLIAQEEARLEHYDLQYIERFRYYAATGQGSGSGVEQNFDLDTSTGFGLATAVGAAHLMLAPFPWQLGGASLRMAFTLPELLVWWWLFFFAVLPGLWHCLRKRFNDIQPLLYFILGLGFLYSLTFSNIGLVYRQRAQLLPWLLIFAAVHLEQKVLRRMAARKAPISPQAPLQPRVNV